MTRSDDNPSKLTFEILKWMNCSRKVSGYLKKN